MLVLQTIELKVLECLVLKSWLAFIWLRVQQARKERFMLQDSVEKYYSFVFPDSLKGVKPQQDSGVCYRHRSASEVFNVAYGFAHLLALQSKTE